MWAMHSFSVVPACRLVLVLALALAGSAAHAAEVVFPPGSRIGLAPPSGLTTSRNFFGFEDSGNRVAFVVVALPAEAYGEIEKSVSADALKAQGVTLDNREELSLPVGKAILLTGRQEIEQVTLHKWIAVVQAPEMTALLTIQVPEAALAAYPDQAIRDAVTSVAVRQTVPIEEQLSLLPFQVNELAGFRVGGVIPGRAVMLTDADAQSPKAMLDPHLVVAIAPGGPAQNVDRGAFARDVFSTIPNVKEVRINSSEPLRIGGQMGHQIMAQGKDNGSGTDITIVQWLRFGGSAYMHLIGIAPVEDWPKAYARFRQVRDGIETR
jgi:hypothetical protein